MGRRSRQKRRSVAKPTEKKPEPEEIAVPTEPRPGTEPPAGADSSPRPPARAPAPEPVESEPPARPVGWTATLMLILAAWLLGVFVRLYWVEEALRPERDGQYLHQGQFLPNTHDSYYFGAIIQKGHLGMHANNTRVPDHYRDGMITILPVLALDYFNAPVFRELVAAGEQLDLAIEEIEKAAGEMNDAHRSEAAKQLAQELREGRETLRGPFSGPMELHSAAENAAELARQKAQALSGPRQPGAADGNHDNAPARAGPALEAAQEHAVRASRLPFLSVENVMTYFPAFFAALLVVPLILIGRLYGSVFWGFLGALLAVTAHSYYNRTLAGYFDTDMFSVTIPALIVWLLLLSIRRNSLAAAVLGGCVLFVFPLFYRSSLPIIYSLGFCYMGWQMFIRHREPTAWQSIVPVGLGMILAPASWGEVFSADFTGWLLRLSAVIGSGLLLKFVPLFQARDAEADTLAWKPLLPVGIVAVLVAGATLYSTSPIQIILARVTQYSSASTATETQKTGSVQLHYKKVITTVQEARRGLSAKEVAWRASGSSLACLLAILGYALLVARHPEFLVALPLLGIGFYTFMGGLRFTEHAVGIAGLSLTYLFFYPGSSRLGRVVLASVAGGIAGGLLWFWLGRMTGTSAGGVDLVLLLAGGFAGYAVLAMGTGEKPGRSETFQNSCIAVLGALAGIAVGKLLSSSLNKDLLRASLTASTLIFTLGAAGLAAGIPWLGLLKGNAGPASAQRRELLRVGGWLLGARVRVYFACLATAIVGGLAWGWMSYEPIDELYRKFKNPKGDVSNRQRAAFKNIETIYTVQRRAWYMSLSTNAISRLDLGNTMGFVTKTDPRNRDLRPKELETVLLEAAGNERFRQLLNKSSVNNLSARAELKAAATKPLGAAYVILGLLMGLVGTLVGGALRRDSRTALAALSGGICFLGLIIGATTQTGYLGIDLVGSFAGAGFLWALLALGAAAMIPMMARPSTTPLFKPCLTVLLAAVAGGAAWYLATRVTGHQVHFLFWPIGAAAGWIVARGRHGSAALPFIAGAAAFLAVLLGKYIWFDIASGSRGNTLGGLANDFPNNFHLAWMFPAIITAALMPMLLKPGPRVAVAWALLGGLLAAGVGGMAWALMPIDQPILRVLCLPFIGLLVGLGIRALDEGEDLPARMVIAIGASMVGVTIGLAGKLEASGTAFSVTGMFIDLGLGKWSSALMVLLFCSLVAGVLAAGIAWFAPRWKFFSPLLGGLSAMACAVWLLPSLQKILPPMLPGLSLDEMGGALQLLNGLVFLAMGAAVGLATWKLAAGQKPVVLLSAAFVASALGIVAGGMVLYGHDFAAFRAWAQSPALLWIFLVPATAVAVTGARCLPDAAIFRELLAGIAVAVVGGLLCHVLSALPATWLGLGAVAGWMVVLGGGDRSTRAAPIIAIGAALCGTGLGITALSPDWMPLSILLKITAWPVCGLILAGFIGWLGARRATESPAIKWLALAAAGLAAALVGALGWVWLSHALYLLHPLPAWPLGALVGLAMARPARELPGWAGPIMAVNVTLAGFLFAAWIMNPGFGPPVPGHWLSFKNTLASMTANGGWLWLLLGAGTAALVTKVLDELPRAMGRAMIAAGVAAVAVGLGWAGLAGAMNEPGLAPGGVLVQFNLPSPLAYGPWVIGAVAGIIAGLCTRESAGWAISLLAMGAALAGIFTGLAAMGSFGGVDTRQLAVSFLSWNSLHHMSLTLLVIMGLGVFTAGALPALLRKDAGGLLVGWPVALLVVVGFLVPNLLHARVQSNRTLPVLYSTMVDLLDDLKQEAKPGDYMITWWDYGTAGWYHAEANVLCHPGDQSDDVYVVAKIFNETNQTAAANLALLAVESYAQRGPAVKGPLAIHQIFNDAIQDQDQDGRDDWTHLPSVAKAGPRGILRELRQPGFPLPKSTRDVYLYLPDNLLRIIHPIRQFSNRDLLDAEKEYQLGLESRHESSDTAKPLAERKEMQIVAMEWFQQAAEKGHTLAQLQMAELQYKIYMAGLQTTRVDRMLDKEEKALFGNFDGIMDHALKGHPRAHRSLAQIWMRQLVNQRGQSLLEAYQWANRALAALENGTALLPKNESAGGFTSRAPGVIKENASHLHKLIGIHMEGLKHLKKEDLPPQLKNNYLEIRSKKEFIQLDASSRPPRGTEHPGRQLTTFTSVTLLPTHHPDNQYRALLLNGYYLAVREDLHIYQRSKTPIPKPGQMWALKWNGRIYSGRYLGEVKDPKGNPFLALKTTGTAAKPGREIAVPKSQITAWFGQWNFIDGFYVTSLDPNNPNQLNPRPTYWNPGHNPWNRTASGLYLVVPFDLMDPSGTAVIKDYRPICIMHRDYFNSTLIRLLLLENHDQNLFQLISRNREGKLYRVKRPSERK